MHMLDHGGERAAEIGGVANGEGERTQNIDVLQFRQSQAEVGAVEARRAVLKQGGNRGARHELIRIVEIGLRQADLRQQRMRIVPKEPRELTITPQRASADDVERCVAHVALSRGGNALSSKGDTRRRIWGAFSLGATGSPWRSGW